jgi:hypothetical protein
VRDRDRGHVLAAALSPSGFQDRLRARKRRRELLEDRHWLVGDVPIGIESGACHWPAHPGDYRPAIRGRRKS